MTAQPAKTRARVLSGIQPTGDVHIGNYLGAIRHWAANQDRAENYFVIVDLHSLTVPQDPELLRANIRELTGILIAAGIDPERSVLFQQSHVPAHAEIAWVLNCYIPLGWLERMTQFKDKTGQNRERASTGLFTYPALMASDILLYDATHVPVGDDQRQHLELTRDVAARLNKQLGKGTVVVPQAAIPPKGARIMSLADPSAKMSKSDRDHSGLVMVLDGPDEIRRKIRRAVTDSENSIRFDPERPGVYNLLSVYQALNGRPEDEIEAEFDGQGYGQLKDRVADALIETLRPLRSRYLELAREPGQIDEILAAGAARAGPVASATRDRLYERIGLI